ncbi:HAD family hydrolase [Streptomyces sp. NPDC088354]|uniref:HAD family hydrolase n=1 Tax=unclassified Streptomyces TaxID=2593676 RepID=UPI0029A2E8B9|nr:HAD family hydrolase [Streptomyces sp. MI02-7b]MDX3075561.1 HAD family hydrolase [Streptomyces sp. MI02-7b]
MSDDHGRAALFDVDGTLVDTNYLHVVAWWEAFRQAGHTVPTAEIHHCIGMGSDHLLDRLLGKARDRSGDEGISAAHKALYGTWGPALAPLDGAADLLRAVAARGFRVVLATSADSKELAVMRAALDADDVIADATSKDDVSASKPAPDLVARALERAGVTAGRAVFVGDTVWDVEAAGKLGVPCVALLSGGIGRAELEAAGAAAVHRDPRSMLARLDSDPLWR